MEFLVQAVILGKEVFFLARAKNLKIQMHQKIDSLLCIGESKHQAKEAYGKYCKDNNIKHNPSKTMGIYSIKTADNYRQVISEFGDWLKSNKNEIWSTKDLSSVSKDTVKEYLQYRDKSCSPYTVSRDMSALNKVLNLDLSKKECNLQQRSYKDVTRSRGDKLHDKQYNANNYKDQILIAQSFGLRRESIVGGSYQIKAVSLFSSYGEVYCSVIEKGGRYREAPCLAEYKEQVLETFSVQERPLQNLENEVKKQQFIELYNSSGNLLFDNYTSKIDNHAFRAEYAQALYNQLLEDNYYPNSDNYRGYVKDALQEVSEALGHNRLSVVVEHYLR